MLEATNDEMCAVPAIDILLKNIASQIIKKALDQNQTDTRGLPGVILSVTLTVNVHLNERLVNGLL